jgi:hypothetical protein
MPVIPSSTGSGSYLDELIAEVREPSQKDLERAEAIAARIRARAASRRAS